MVCILKQHFIITNMKKTILIILLAIGLASCTESTVKITDEKTELPNKVVKSLDDTILVKQYAIIETDNMLYLLTKKDTEKKFYVEKTVAKMQIDSSLVIAMFLLILFLFIVILITS